MRTFKTYLFLLLLGVLIGFLAPKIKKYYDDRHKPSPISPTLGENEKKKVIVKRDTIVVVDRVMSNDGQSTEVVTERRTGVRRDVALIVKDDGEVEVVAPTHGKLQELGLTAFYSDKQICVGVDLHYFYWKRWSCSVGAGLGTNELTLRTYAAVNYVLPYEMFSNTSVFMGMDHDIKLIAGARIRF